VRAPEERTGFRIEYGALKADDLTAYLKSGRRPVKWSGTALDHRAHPLQNWSASPCQLSSSPFSRSSGSAGPALGSRRPCYGTVLFPALLPYLPTKDYSSKGLLLGLPCRCRSQLTSVVNRHVGRLADVRVRALCSAGDAIHHGATSLNFTGATPFPSRTGVRKEIYTYIPVIAGMRFGS
jgi:hypothetical protein